MAAFVVHNNGESQRRSDGLHAFLVTAADAAAARTAAEVLCGFSAGSFSGFNAVQVQAGDLSTEDVAFQGGVALGGKGQTDWPLVSRGGNTLPSVSA